MEKNDIQKELDSNIPAEAVETREAWRGGPKLSYLSGAYVIDRMNQVLGQGNWDYTLVDLTKVYEGTIAQTNADAYTTSYTAKVRLTARFGPPSIEYSSVSFTDVGYGDGTDKKSPGKAHELAVKEAVTDGLKRAAKNLGRSMGLGLYFKSGEYVDEANITKNDEPAKQQAATAVQEQPAAAPAKPSAVSPKKKIKSAFKVLEKMGIITAQDFTQKYTAGAKVDELNDDTAASLYTTIKKDFPQLNLQ